MPIAVGIGLTNECNLASQMGEKGSVRVVEYPDLRKLVDRVGYPLGVLRAAGVHGDVPDTSLSLLDNVHRSHTVGILNLVLLATATQPSRSR